MLAIDTLVQNKNTGVIGTLIAVNGGWSDVQIADGEVVKMRNGQIVEAPKAKKVVEFHECKCGCGAMVKGEFKMGHDQRYKGQLMRRAVADDVEAINELIDRGWRTVEQIAMAVAKANRARKEGPRCVRCGQVLTDAKSIAAGIGPICQHRVEAGEDEIEQ